VLAESGEPLLDETANVPTALTAAPLMGGGVEAVLVGYRRRVALNARLGSLRNYPRDFKPN
jgi:hypothetical protein